MKKTHLIKERLQKLAGIAKKKYSEGKLKPFKYIDPLTEQEEYWPDEIDPDLMGDFPLIFWHPDGGYANTVVYGPCGQAGSYYAGSELSNASLFMYPPNYNGQCWPEEAYWPIADYILGNNLPLDTQFNMIYWDADYNTTTAGSSMYGINFPNVNTAATDGLDLGQMLAPCTNPDISNVSGLGPSNAPTNYQGLSGYEFKIGGFSLQLEGFTIQTNDAGEATDIIWDTGAAGFSLGVINSLYEILEAIVDHCLYTMTQSDEFPEVNSWDDCNDLGMSTPAVLAGTYGLGGGSTWADWYNFLGSSLSYECPAISGVGTHQQGLATCGRDYCQCECQDPSGCIDQPDAIYACGDPEATNYYCTQGTGQLDQCELITFIPMVFELPENFIECDDCCTYDLIPGCVDETADNYNSNATLADNDLCLWNVICYKCQYPDGIIDFGAPGTLETMNFESSINPSIMENPCPQGWSTIEPDCSGDEDKVVEPEIEIKKYACKVTSMVSPTESNYECIEDPNGPFSSIGECQDSGCGDPEGTKKKKCYKCENNSPVGFMFDDPPGCPKGWQAEILTFEDCKDECDNPLVDEWLNNNQVIGVHCCETGGVSPDCQEVWLNLGGSLNFNPVECCPGPSSDGQPGRSGIAIPPNTGPLGGESTTLQRLRELAGIKTKK